MSDILAVTYEDAHPVVVGGARDPNGPYAALQATTTAGTVTVNTLRGTQVTIYLPLGQIVPLAVKNVQALGSAVGVVGFNANPYAGGQQ